MHYIEVYFCQQSGLDVSMDCSNIHSAQCVLFTLFRSSVGEQRGEDTPTSHKRMSLSNNTLVISLIITTQAAEYFIKIVICMLCPKFEMFHSSCSHFVWKAAWMVSWYGIRKWYALMRCRRFQLCPSPDRVPLQHGCPVG